MKTRRFKALNGAKGKYSAIVEKIAIYDDNNNQIDCAVIQTDDNGREYYYPNNPHDSLGLFSGRIKDAIECIRSDFGDAIEQSHLLGFSMDHVVRYIDRKYGESIRQQSIEDWKDTVFAYGVKFRFINSFYDGNLIMKDETLMNPFSGDLYSDILRFDTEEEAQRFIDKVNKKAEEYYEEYAALEETGNHDYDYNNIFSPFFNKIKGESNNRDSIYWKVFSALVTEKERNEKVYKLKVVQVIVATEEEVKQNA